MKGRRKVKTRKWLLKAKCVVEAQLVIACGSKEAAQRFFDAASQFGAGREQVGRIARCSSPRRALQKHALALSSSSGSALTRSDKQRRPSEEREREMLALARAHILTCGDFFMLPDLANHLGIHVELLSPALRAWEADHRIFSIDHDGFTYFPVYAFPLRGGASPIAALRDVLSILSLRKDGWGVSFWFISPNGWLGGTRPQDLLSADPGRVISAAHDEASVVTHG